MAVSFLKHGKDAVEAERREVADREARSKAVWRFWIPTGGSTSITFLDGDLDPDGILAVPRWYEHQVFMNGNWRNWFVCVSEDEVCPLCEGGDHASLVTGFTVLDHSEYTDKKGTVHKNEVRLFVAKADTLQRLQKRAEKLGGLAGARFDVSRFGDKSANVGSDFDFVEKQTAAYLSEKYGPSAKVIDYQEALVYMPAADLRRLGFGSANPVGAVTGTPPTVDFSKDL